MDGRMPLQDFLVTLQAQLRRGLKTNGFAQMHPWVDITRH